MSYGKVHTLAFSCNNLSRSERSSLQLGACPMVCKARGYTVVVFAPDWQNELDSSFAINLDKMIIERYPSKPWDAL